MAERHDAGVAEDQVERQREQDQDQDLGAEEQVVGEGEERAEREQPGQRLPWLPAVARRDAGPRGGDARGAQTRSARPNRPSGLRSRSATVAM